MPPPGKNKNSKNNKCPPLPKFNDEQVFSTSTANKDLEQLKREFEVELCWCIEQLQKALTVGKLNKKQVQDHVKALNTLMNNSTPMAQKRQVMRFCFGDYRAKMATEEKKYSGKVNAKIITAKPDSKSTFVKKSTFLTTGEGFIFNFDVLNVDENYYCANERTLKKNSSQEAVKIDTNCNNFKFIPSNNTFKFSFDIDNS